MWERLRTLGSHLLLKQSIPIYQERAAYYKERASDVLLQANYFVDPDKARAFMKLSQSSMSLSRTNDQLARSFWRRAAVGVTRSSELLTSSFEFSKAIHQIEDSVFALYLSRLI